MATSAQPALCSLLTTLLTSPDITITTSIPPNTTHHTGTLILAAAPSAPTPQLVELLLHILLSQPPFTHTSPSLWTTHKEQFLQVWVQSHLVPHPPDASNLDTLSPAAGLSILAAMRPDFQSLSAPGFQLVSELLHACVKQLSPQGEGGKDIKEWVRWHGVAIDVLEELLHSVPSADTQDLDALAGWCEPLWRILQLLVAGASWWGADNAVYSEDNVRLARHLFTVPVAASLFRAALRVDMQPGEIHATVTTLLEPLEEAMGVGGAGKINAFTPSPFLFPTLPMLDRHEFTKDYEFASLRVLFVCWVAAEREERCLTQPKMMHAVLQHSEAFRRLKAHPHSAVRVALMYIFNETKNGGQGFKPSTDLLAIELLKVFIAYKHVHLTAPNTPTSPGKMNWGRRKVEPGGPEKCVTAHAGWVLPWLWRRRVTDGEFVMVMTCAWLNAACVGTSMSSDHEVYKLVKANVEPAFGVFHDLFRHIFNNDFVEKSADRQTTMQQIRRLFRIVLDLALLLEKDGMQVLTGHFAMMLMRCCVESLDSEWLPVECWERAVKALVEVPKKTLAEATKLAGIVEGCTLFFPIFLRELEAITALCEVSTPDQLNSPLLTNKLTLLTTQVHFLTLLATSHPPIASLLTTKPHFTTTSLHYITRLHTPLLLTPTPPLLWSHAASISSLLTLLTSTSFGLPDFRTSRDPRRPEADRLLQLLLARSWEMSFITSPLCTLATLLPPDHWRTHPFTYLELLAYIRHVLLDTEIHRWCAFLPSFLSTLAALLALDIPARHEFLTSRWTMALAARLLRIIAAPAAACPVCDTPLVRALAEVLALVLRGQAWMRDVLRTGGLGTRYSFLEYEALEGTAKAALETERWEEAEAVMRVLECWEEWRVRVKMLRRGLGRRRVLARAEAGAAAGGEWRWVLLVRGVSGVLVKA